MNKNRVIPPNIKPPKLEDNNINNFMSKNRKIKPPNIKPPKLEDNNINNFMNKNRKIKQPNIKSPKLENNNINSFMNKNRKIKQTKINPSKLKDNNKIGKKQYYINNMMETNRKQIKIEKLNVKKEINHHKILSVDELLKNTNTNKKVFHKNNDKINLAVNYNHKDLHHYSHGYYKKEDIKLNKSVKEIVKDIDENGF